MSNNSKLIPSLNGLRGISIGLVIFAHSTDGNFVGNLGVRIFFVISGFLITYLLLKEFNSTNKVNLKRFYFRRTMRIFAPFYFYLLIIGILGLFGVVALAAKDFITAFTYTNDYLFSDSWYVGHSWSLAVEEQFYLLFPPLLVVLRKKKIIATLIFILLLAPVLRIVGYHLYPQYEDIAILYGFHANMDALASGCLLAFAAEYENSRNFLLKIAKLPQAIVILLILVVYFFNTQNAHPHLFLAVYVPFMNIGIAFIIYWAITNSESSFIGKILNTKVLSFIGVLSYSLYLWQQLFTGKEMLRFFPFNLVAAFACALFSYYTVERYSLKLRAYLENSFYTPQSNLGTWYRKTATASNVPNNLAEVD